MSNVHKIILEEDEGIGVYIFVFPPGSSTYYRDYLQDNMEMAKEFIADRYLLKGPWVQTKGESVILPNSECELWIVNASPKT